MAAITAQYCAIVIRLNQWHYEGDTGNRSTRIIETRWIDSGGSTLTRPGGTTAFAVDILTGSTPASESIDDLITTSSYWQSANHSPSSYQAGDLWIAYNFGASFDFDGIEICCWLTGQEDGNNIVDCDFWVSTDGTNWEMAGVTTDELSWTNAEFRQFQLLIDSSKTASVVWNSGDSWPTDPSGYDPAFGLAASFTFLGLAPSIIDTEVPTAEFDLTGIATDIQAIVDTVVIPAARFRFIGLDDIQPAHFTFSANSVTTVRDLAANIPRQIVHRCYLIADSFDDLELKISSWQARLRDGEPSYLAVVVPNVSDMIDDIIDRLDGYIVLYRGYRLPDGTEQLEELWRTQLTIDGVRTDAGASSASGTFSGYRTGTTEVPKIRAIQGGSYINTVGEQTRYRSPVDLFLRIGDTAVLHDASQITVRTITYTVNAILDQMEITN